jgi:outer membrane protein
MKRYGLLVAGLATFILLFSGSLYAAAEKIGFVNVQTVMVTSTVGKKEAEDLKKAIDKENATFTERDNELKKLKDELEKQRPLLKEDALKDKESAFQKKVRDFQLMLKDSKEELQAREQDISKRMIPEILKVVNAIGQKENFTMIVDVSLIPLAYYAKENDLTKRVTDEFNKTYNPSKK